MMENDTDETGETYWIELEEKIFLAALTGILAAGKCGDEEAESRARALASHSIEMEKARCGIHD